MTELTLVIGSEARTADDKLSGYVKSVVVDRGTRTVTHLVVEPTGREGLARLVQLDDHVDARDSTLRLDYTEAEFKNLTAAEDALAEVFNSGPVELVSEGWRAADDEPVVDGSAISTARAVFRGEIDLVPVLLPAEEEEHRGDHVHATDGEIGQLRALGIDPGTHQVTHVHVLLKEGLLRRGQDVAIPSDSVSGFTGGIHLSISRQQVAELAHQASS
jgi:sporulation protein YlmC with PRC-barrel domain